MRILLIEDDAVDAKAAQRALRIAFPEAVVDRRNDARPEDAAQIAQIGYDCVLLDYQLPSVLGIELLERFHADDVEHLAVIMLTGAGSERIAVEAMKAGAEDYLRKDEISPDLLRRAVLGAVERVRLQRQVAEYQQRIEHRALHDPLTELGNRAHFHACLDRLLAAALRRGDGLGLMLIDLDRFKAVNDTFGHQVGDHVLQKVAGLLSALVRRADMPFRLGGDEFAILLDTGISPAGICHLGQRIVEAARQPICIGEDEVYIGASIGIALYPVHGEDADTLISQADAAMYEAKRNGIGCSVASMVG